MRKVSTIILFFILGCSISYSQNPGEMVTDRPDQSESTNIVPPGYVQIEGGASYDKYTDDDFYGKYEASYTSISGLIRIGVFPNMELRIAPEYSVYNSEISFPGFPTFTSKVDGLNPLVIGTKIRILEETESLPGLAFLFHVDFPDLASKKFKGGYSTPEVRVALSNQLTDRFSLGVNGGAMFDMGTRQTVGLYTIAVGADITNKLGGFFELYGFFHGESSHFLDGGLTYSFMENLQADISGGVGLSEYTSDYFIGGGLTVRLPR
jgi:hypothetical protein